MIDRPRTRTVDLLKDLFRTESARASTLKLPTADVADLLAYVETLEAELGRLRASQNFGTDAA